MTADVVSGRRHRRGEWRIAFDRAGAGEQGQRQAVPLEQAQYSPGAGACAVLEHRFGAEVTPRHVRARCTELGQVRLGVLGPVGHRGLAALLHVEHEVEREPRAGQASSRAVAARRSR